MYVMAAIGFLKNMVNNVEVLSVTLPEKIIEYHSLPEDSNGIYPVAQPSSHAFPSPSVGKCEEPDVIVDSTTGLSGTVSRDFNEEAVQVEQNEDPQTRLPIKVEVDEEKSEFDAGVTERRPERIDQYSPVVYSGHLETALRRDYGGLVEVVSPGEQQLGRHERPQ